MTFLKYKLDLEELRRRLNDYGSDCTNRFARKRLQGGLVSAKGVTSFSKYARMGHWLGFFDFNLKTGLINSNSVTKIVSDLIKRFNIERCQFKLPYILKLLSTYLLIENDKNLIIPLVITLRDTNANSRIINTREFQLRYIRNIVNTYQQLLSGISSSNEYSALAKRLNFFYKNLNLLENGQPSTRGLLHMIEPRINWLLDLSLTDHNILCNSGGLYPIEAWSDLSLSPHESLKNDTFFKNYLGYIKDKNENLAANFQNMDVSDIITLSIKILQKDTGEMLLVEDVLLLAWILCNSGDHNYVGLNDVLKIMETDHTIYRRKMAGLGLIQT